MYCLCKCVLPPGDNPMAVNKYIISYISRRLHNDVLYDLYSSPNIIRVLKQKIMGLAVHVVLTHGWQERCIEGCGLRPEEKRPLGRSRHRWKNIKMDFKEMRWGVCAGLVWLRVGTGGRIL